MVQKKLYNMLIFICIFLVLGETKLNENYINKSFFIAPWTEWLISSDIPQKAWYNFVISSISVVTDCINNNSCVNLHLQIIDNTWSWNLVKFFYSSEPIIKNEIVNKDPIIIMWNISLNNQSIDAWAYVNITWYYLDIKDDIFFQFYENNKNNLYFYLTISLIITILFYIYLPLFFWNNGFSIWKNYFNKKKKNEFN